MIVPYNKEQNHVDNLLKSNTPIKAYIYIFNLLKGDDKDDIDLKLFAINNLIYIASEYLLRCKNEVDFHKPMGKAEKLIRELKYYRTTVLKGYKIKELDEALLSTEASLHQSMFNFKGLRGENYSVILEKHLQLAISNYWRGLRICSREDEKYNIRNNLANCLVQVGRFIEAIALFNENIKKFPSRFQSLASWSDAMEKLKIKASLPELPSFYFALSEKYFRAKKTIPEGYLKKQINENLKRWRLILEKEGCTLNEATLQQNRTDEQSDFQKFSEYRQYVLSEGLSLNEHALHCHCENAKFDDLSVGLYGGSIHSNKPEILQETESYLNRIKSEYVFARLLFYKYKNFDSASYNEDDFQNTAILHSDEVLGHKVEHLRTSYRILYGLLDKIASAILVQYNITQEDNNVYFESVFSQFSDLSSKTNIHLCALKSMSLDLSQSLEGKKVGSLGFYKKIRNKLEHGLLILTTNKTDEEQKQINIIQFESFVLELLKLTKAAIFSLNYLIRTETIIFGH